MGNAGCLAAVGPMAVSRLLPWRPQMLQRLLMLLKPPPPGGRTVLQPPCLLMPLTPLRLHYVVPTRNSPSDLLQQQLDSGSSFRQMTAPRPPKMALTLRTAGDATRTDTSSPAPPETPTMKKRNVVGYRRLVSLPPVSPHLALQTARTTATSTTTTTAMMIATPL